MRRWKLKSLLSKWFRKLEDHEVWDNVNPPPPANYRLPMPPVSPPKVPQQVLMDEIEHLQRVIKALTDQVEEERQRRILAVGEVRALSRRINKLKDTWPAVHKDFFTAEGDKRRSEGKHTHHAVRKNKHV